MIPRRCPAPEPCAGDRLEGPAGPRVPWSCRAEPGPRVCSSNKLPGDAGAAGPRVDREQSREDAQTSPPAPPLAFALSLTGWDPSFP